MTVKVGVSGSWRDVAEVKVGIGGNWKRVPAIWVGVGGSWKLLTNGMVSALTAADFIAGPVWTGFANQSATGGGIWGSLSPVAFPDLNAVRIVGNKKDNTAATVQIKSLSSAEESQSYLNYVSSNGVTLLGADATYSWTSSEGGIGTWTWNGSTFNFVDGGNYTVVFALSPI